MKISLDWLRDYVAIDLSPGELAERLTRAGLAVEAIAPAGSDVVLDVETTSNRPDHLGHIGVAREVAWICGVPLRLPADDFPGAARIDGRALEAWTRVRIEDLARCSRYVARVAFGARVGPAPDWVRRRLEAIGVRPINSVVDLTNYVLFEWGQPLHAFDYDRLEGGEIVVRRARPRETMTAINERSYELSADDLVIADARRPVALAGIMGARDSEVGEGTRRVLLESAWFEPIAIRRSARRLALASDASYRFERGVDPGGVELASRRYCHLLARWTGATILGGAVEVAKDGFVAAARRRIRVTPAKVAQVLGVTITAQRISGGLAGMGFEVEAVDPEGVRVRTPSYRADVEREIDLVEEVARFHGLDAIPETVLGTFPVAANPERAAVERIKTWMVAAGYHEALTLSFVEEGEFRALERLWSSAPPFEVRNPIRAPERFLRRSLLPNLLAAVRLNRQRGVLRVRLFEVARVFPREPGRKAPAESIHLAWVDFCGERGLREARGIAEGVLRSIGAATPEWTVECAPELFPGGDGASFRAGDRLAGVAGAVAIDGVPGPVWCGEIALDTDLARGGDERRIYREISRQPGIRRDVNMMFAEEVLWRDIVREVRALDLADLEGVDFVDLYRGKQVEAGKKSVTFALRFRSEARSLRHEEAEDSVRRTIDQLARRFGAVLRE